MSNPYRPAPNRGFGPPGHSIPTPPPSAESPSPKQPGGPSNSILLWILLGIGACGLVSLCCVSGLFVVLYQQRSEMAFDPDPARPIQQRTAPLLNQPQDESLNPKLDEYRKQMMEHTQLAQYVGKIESLDYSRRETAVTDDTESLGYELRGSIRSGTIIVFESEVNGHTVARKAVFKSKNDFDPELWIVF